VRSQAPCFKRSEQVRVCLPQFGRQLIGYARLMIGEGVLMGVEEVKPLAREETGVVGYVVGRIEAEPVATCLRKLHCLSAVADVLDVCEIVIAENAVIV